MDVTDRVKEAIKQTRLAKQEVDDADVSEELKDAIEALEDASETLADDD
ncbi:hypothetical protein [Haloarcula marismortui]|uniref:Uncharacterized protein n=1 Tax=Haloarcula marismortui ATCC 33800 TaxID=662476 RepID=A0A8T8KFN9_9EURY|nr:hypothetical protein [Haloarcula sinaiiensis]QUJ73970.1 hypothetical protein KDQ40_18540 [Haloarcula sinaiiensis ATCC 33800]